ncbi:TPA: O-antigen polysaccharide polymerase Wzy [Morganella morganii]|nr:O-antigen polysaccharide polymerase Wzy [Morganella morganii]
MKTLPNNSQHFNQIISLIFLLLFGTFSVTLYYLELDIDVSSTIWSLLFISFCGIVFGLKKINRISLLSAQSLFTLTIMLFLGGRFFSQIFILEPIEIFQLNFFAHYTLSSLDATKLFLLLLIGISYSEAGQYFALLTQRSSTQTYKMQLIGCLPKQLLWIYILVALGGLLYIINVKLQLVLQHGYLGLYKAQSSETYSSQLESILNTLFWICMGLTLSYGNKKQKKILILMFLIYAASALLLGARSLFGTFILFSLWLYGDFGRKKFSSIKFIIIAIIFILSVNALLISTGLRGSVASDSSLLKTLHTFFYNQGITLMVFDVSMRVENYPIIAYFQSVFPGASYIASFLTTTPVHEIHFGSYLSYSLNSEYYKAGNGVGWSIFSDIYLYSNRNIVFYSLLFFLWGWLLTKLEKASTTNFFIRGLAITLIPKILFVARASLSTIIPLAIYYIVIAGIFYLINTSLNNRKRD